MFKKSNKLQAPFIAKLKLLLCAAIFIGAAGTFLVSQGYTQSRDDDDDSEYEEEISYQVARNPTLTKACGLDIGLVLDHSMSIKANQMTQMKSAMTSFVNALGSTSTQFSVTKFAATGVVLRNFTGDSGAVNASISSINADGRGTNWKDGLTKVQGTYDPRPDKQNLILFATDGDPTDPGGNQNALREAVTVANALKTSGIRILVLGIGPNANQPNQGLSRTSLNNLHQISGPNLNTGDLITTDVLTTSFDTLTRDLALFAGQACGSPTPLLPGPGGTTGGGGGGGGGSVAKKQSPAPAPTPSPSAQGEQAEQPKPEPSPFYDGKEFKPGSEADNQVFGTSTIGGRKVPKVIFYVIGAVLLGGAAGTFLWRWKHKG